MGKTKYETAFDLIDAIEQYQWRQKALTEYDGVMFCPVCRRLLTGLHENSSHFQKYLSKIAAKLWLLDNPKGINKSKEKL